MEKTITVRFKATGEHFDIPYQSQTTIQKLIEYVCRQSTASPNSNPEHYYMAINNSDVLDNHRTVEDIGLNRIGQSVSLQVCMKSGFLIQRILNNYAQRSQTPPKRVPQKSQETVAIEKPIHADKTSFPTEQQQQQVRSTTAAAAAAIPVNDDTNNKVHILVCGGPKVGKSTLINALCGCSVAKAGTMGLEQCTQKTSYYQLDNIYFWDTPGIQEWSHLDIDSYINSSTQRQTPLCMFYCASPGSFTKLKQLDMLLDECIYRRHIFCVLVVTNMFANNNRRAIIDEFKTLLSKYVDRNDQIREEQGVWYYGQVGLCTMVNSREYIDEDTNQLKSQIGINELVLAMIKSLSRTHRLGSWLRTIEQNRQFWLDKQEELYNLT